ncbi:MAG: pitrilysin family protein [Chloroflexota bacterium]
MYQKTTLPGGLRVITTAMPHLRSVSVCIFTGAGSRYEQDSEAGISHYIEHLLFRGTPKRPSSREISQAIEGVGGVLNAATDKELTLYWTKVTQEHLTLALDVLTDMFLHAKLETADIEKERQVIIEEINMSLDSPSQRTEMLIDELLYPNHPLGRDIAGSKETVAGMNREMMLGYLNRQYLPQNTVVSIAGNISHAHAVAEVEKLLGGWASTQKQAPYLAFQSNAGARLKTEKRDIEEVHLNLALPGLSLFHPQRFVLGLLNNILGSGMSSRLFLEVRDRLGLCYSIHSYVGHHLDAGSLVIGAGVEPKNLVALIQATTHELARLKEKVPEWELEKAREITKGHLILRLEDSRDTASWAGAQETLMGRILTIDDVVRIIDAITTEEVQKLAEELLVGEKLRLAAVGPVKEEDKLEELLRI